MRHQKPRSDRVAIAAALGVLLLSGLGARAEDPLRPFDPSAPPVQILLVVPSGSGYLAKQVKRLERELAAAPGPFVRARSVAEADAVVEFTRCWRTMDGGRSSDWWEGQFRLLSPAAREAQAARKMPEHFRLVVGEQESWEMAPVLHLLGRTLAKALGREVPPTRNDSI